MRRFVIAGFLLLALSGCPAEQRDLVSTRTPDARGMVSAADPRAAEAGAEMLRRGGSATDAAIATMIALTVVEPQSSGIGGGGFFLHGDAEGSIETIDGRETAPMAAGPDWFLDEAGNPRPYFEAVLSGLSVGVPGNIRLAALAHERHGRLAWRELFDPAIELARDGWVITERTRDYLLRAENRAAATEAGRALFYDADGEPLAVGSVVRNPALVATFEMLAEEGPEAFYRSDNAQAIVSTVSAATPRARAMVTGDLEYYAARMREPVCGNYRAYRICGMGPPSSGATTVLAILGQLEGYDIAGLGRESPVAWHLFAESQRLAFADREFYLGDSDFVPVPVWGLVDPGYLADRAELI
ncbi:MAG TPA: gamma-glutamyltransferase, partial [Sphingomonadaceae bacterium]|nr:gamma-glutamyltransferase [Sphingomonadaceae bacterium]